ncbi:Hypothetical Protein FCC1311_097922 [Hondaea fermentalgiana]|uniref:BZIP domain-containing protein n=1 Tax=Hondaea fermentalgiana TaxID=2315210 RepID=A0A2R5GTB9_9STRA|nr:Hypothetical Protein FCC1311_097922 [Hondaea fermentalgiana]|eukprot:GBG33569.1 Hypothetical Protein FCC1311_097922 [Hondaea fermentalgiana]
MEALTSQIDAAPYDALVDLDAGFGIDLDLDLEVDLDLDLDLDLNRSGGSSDGGGHEGSRGAPSMATTLASSSYSPAAEPRTHGVGSDGAKNVREDTYSARRRRNAASSRKVREKRKAERDALALRVSELQQDNELLLERIAVLQNEVQAQRFKDGGAGLEKENALLRAEIKRHKAFMERIVRVVHDHDTDQDETVQRTYLASVRSSLSRVMGMLYTSAHDPSWKPQPISSLSQASATVSCFYAQTLPLGVPTERAKVLNMRIDVDGVPLSQKRALARAQRMMTDAFTTNAVFRLFQQLQEDEERRQNLRINEFTSPGLRGVQQALKKQNEELHIFSYADNVFEILVSMSSCTSQLNLSALGPRDASKDTDDASPPSILEADVMLTSTLSHMLSAAILPSEADLPHSTSTDKKEDNVMAADLLEGIVFFTRDGAPADESSFIFVSTMPINTHMTILPRNTHDKDGTVATTVRQQMTMFCECVAMAPELDVEAWAAMLRTLAARQQEQAQAKASSSCSTPASTSASSSSPSFSSPPE